MRDLFCEVAILLLNPCAIIKDIFLPLGPGMLAQLRADLDQKKISALELAHIYLKRIQASTHNAFVYVDEEATITQAKAADIRLAKGDGMPLLGIPIAHKDVFVTKDWYSSAGSRMLKNYKSPFDATVVSRLKNAGAVCLGKTNMDEFAMGSSNENSYFGAVDHPFDANLVPGGSSGGSAVAVALHLSPLATGSDTGGSIRQPACFCGITGIKPTYGSVSRYGMIAYASSLDQAGMMAHTVRDAAVGLEAIIGMDDEDSTCVGHTQPQFLPELDKIKTPKAIAGMRIGVPEEFFTGVDAHIAQQVMDSIALFQAHGAEIVPIHLSNNHLSIPCYYVIASAQASSNLARFDGVRYGHRSDKAGNLEDLYIHSRSEGFGQEVKKRIMMGAYVLSSGYYDAYYMQALKVRRLIAQDFLDAFDHCDVIITPVSPVLPWLKGAKQHANDMYLADILTLGASLAGLPAMSIPCQKNDQKGIGMQMIAPHFKEADMMKLGHVYQTYLL